MLRARFVSEQYVRQVRKTGWMEFNIFVRFIRSVFFSKSFRQTVFRTPLFCVTTYVGLSGSCTIYYLSINEVI